MFLHALAGLLGSILLFFGLAAPTTSAPITPSDNQVAVPSASPTTTGTTGAATASVNAQEPSASTHAIASVPLSTAVSGDLPTGSAWLSTIPLGDGKYVTSGPKVGYIYLCHLASGGGGAQAVGPWIHGVSWTPSEKVRVLGSVSWPTAYFRMTLADGERTISFNDLPTDHTTGIFPIQADDPAAAYDRNPSAIAAHSYTYTLPSAPSETTSPNCIYGAVGVMADGVLLLDGFDAEYRDAAAHELQDSHDGHPNNMGYHYHGFETDFVTDSVSTVVGYAFDGFPITGSKLPSGAYLHTADLDACHGLTSTVRLDGKDTTTYHYVLTQDFPYSVGCFKGKSYEPKPGGGQTAAQSASTSGAGEQSAGSPPQAAITACASLSVGASCAFAAPNGAISGTCKTPPGQAALACVPQ